MSGFGLSFRSHINQESQLHGYILRRQAWHPDLEPVCSLGLAGCVSSEIMIAQGLMLLSPAIDVPRTLLLRVMEMLQGLVLPYFPHWRIVPSPPIHVVTEDPKLVRPLSLSTPPPHASCLCAPSLHAAPCCMRAWSEESTLRHANPRSHPCEMPSSIFNVAPALSSNRQPKAQADSACRGRSCWQTRI